MRKKSVFCLPVDKKYLRIATITYLCLLQNCAGFLRKLKNTKKSLFVNAMKYKKYKPQNYSTEFYTTSDLYKQQLISPQGQRILEVFLFGMHGEARAELAKYVQELQVP